MFNILFYIIIMFLFTPYVFAAPGGVDPGADAGARVPALHIIIEICLIAVIAFIYRKNK
ncbi:hypothetical protein [Thalassotalea agariperforans]